MSTNLKKVPDDLGDKTARLIGERGQMLELTLLGYEFHESTLWNDFDANWLSIRLFVKDGSDEWSRDDAALLVPEVHELAAWLSAIAIQQAGIDPIIEFTEPNLSFEAETIGETIRLTAYFSHEFLPPGHKRLSDVVSVSFDVPPCALRDFTAELTAALRDFPVRIVESNGSTEAWAARLGAPIERKECRGRPGIKADPPWGTDT